MRQYATPIFTHSFFLPFISSSCAKKKIESERWIKNGKSIKWIKEIKKMNDVNWLSRFQFVWLYGEGGISKK